MRRLHSSSTASLAALLDELPQLSRKQLIELWVEHLGGPPPKAASPSLLLRAVGHAIQEQQLGGLTRQDARALLKFAIVTPGAARGRIPAFPPSKEDAKGNLASAEIGSQPDAKSRSKPHASSKSAVPLKLRPGTRLVREWQGKSHTVDVQDGGYGWNGEVYRSLSAVALAITGARGSGNRFFRL